MRVTFLAPSSETSGSFYEVFADFLRVAAQQLEIDFQVVYGTKLRKDMIERGQEIAASALRPNYILLANYMDPAPDLLPVFSAAGVGVFFVVDGIGGTERLASTRKRYPACLGEIVPDDTEAGRMLADILVSAARQRRLVGADGKIHLGALAGAQTRIGQSRFRGWQAFKDGHADVVQAGFQYGSWEEKEGMVAAAMLLRSAPELNVIWCANDAMALGAVRAATDAGRKPGDDMLIGGFDLLDRALAAIVEGAMYASIGGHIVDGVRALLMLYDHDQKPSLELGAHTTHLVAVKADRARDYLGFMRSRAWRNVDFTRFSARRNPRGAQELSLPALLAAAA